MNLSDFLLKLRALFRSRQMDEELAEEMQTHLEMQARKNIAAGMSPKEARRQARLQFGGIESATEECRDVRGMNFFERSWRDFRFALRGFRRTPGFTTVALLALMLGIGANTAIFSVVYSVLLAPLPYPHPEQLVMVWSKVNGHRGMVSAGDYLDWRQQNSVFQDVLAWSGASFNLSVSGNPEVVQARICAPGLLDLQGIPFSMGRDFLPEEGQVGKDHVAVMTHRTWQQRFESDPNILGRQIRLNGEPYTVVGVLASGMADRFESQIMVPLAFKPEQITHNRHWLLAMGRMKPGVTLEQANADMNNVMRHIAEEYPTSNKGWGASVEALHHDFTSPQTIRALWLLMGAVGFVLLIACVNVANLLLARGTVRQKEVAVRASLGARRSQLFSQFLTESLALALFGGALGVGFAWALLKAVMAILPPFSIPTEADVRLNLPVLFFSLVSTLIAGVLCGCAPAWQSSRWNLSDALKESVRSTDGSGRLSLRRSLIVVEFALALTLLAGAGLALHSFWNITRVDFGFRSDHILTFSTIMPTNRFATSEQTAVFYRQLLEKIQALPGVSSASVSTGMPVTGTNYGLNFSVVGHSPADPSSRSSAGFTMVTPDYFRTFGMQILKGRSFTEQDTAGGEPVAIVNETFARKYLASLDPLSQQVAVDKLSWGAVSLGSPINWRIIGIYRDVRNNGAGSDHFPEINVPFWQNPWPDAEIQVRTDRDPESMIPAVAAAIHSVDPDLGMNRVRTMDQVVSESFAGERFVTVFLATFAAIALLLAAIGIYGVMSFGIAQRTREIGLRMALGAGRARVLALVLKEGFILALAGLGVGLLGAGLVGRLMKSLLYEVNATDPLSIAAVSGVLLLCALLACYVPGRRAAHVEPMVALRNE